MENPRFVSCHACHFWAKEKEYDARPGLANAECWRHPPVLLIDRVDHSVEAVDAYVYTERRPVTESFSGCGEGRIRVPTDD